MMTIGSAQQLPLLGPDTPLGPGGDPGVDVDFFPLPPVDQSGPNYTVGGTGYMTALTDRPEVRALMQYIASKEWGRFWAGTAADSDNDMFISPNRRFEEDAYRGIPTQWGIETFAYDSDRDPADAAIRVRIHEFTRRALDADAWRNDASDAMPPEIGTWTSDFETGAFWQGMVDWVDSKKPIEEILADIDAQWAALNAASG
jgi:ABC-type glycerol-3-phosphate transport system substrate-binding protein